MKGLQCYRSFFFNNWFGFELSFIQLLFFYFLLCFIDVGKTSHAAAAPWEGINALDAAVSCYNNVSMLRQQIKPTNRIHCTIVDGGEKPNIIPERSEMCYYVRAQTDSEVKNLVGRLRKCAEGAAQSTGIVSHLLREFHFLKCQLNDEALMK